MQRLIYKTVGITLAVVFGTVVLVFGALTLFNPKAMGELFDGCGNYTVAVWYYEKQYNSTDAFDDLKILVDKLDEKGDARRTDKYASLLIGSTDFVPYAESNGIVEFGNRIGVYEYYYGKCAIARSVDGRMKEAIDVSASYVERYGYTEFNPYRLVIAEAGKDLSKEDLVALTEAVESLGISETAQDIQDIQLLINAKGE